MKPKVVNLQLHKNTLARRKRKELKAEALLALKTAFDECEGAAYAIVVLDKDETPTTVTNMGDFSPSQFALLLRDALAVETMSGGSEQLEAEENE